MLQTSVFCLLCTLWLPTCADTFKSRNLLANSPFLGLATDDDVDKLRWVHVCMRHCIIVWSWSFINDMDACK